MLPVQGELRSLNYGYEAKVKQIFIICPRCQVGRWVFLQVARRKNFTGLCPGCLKKVFEEALAPYRKKTV